ncbi:MAG TPA: patatin family protein [Smithellaceae bacterium]|nr:patatin family protein [Smithellaceae bacterium]HRS88210.1 patatin family protein [Smithellaceae bacterium]HRV25682.1 patatin family protein [Smithellaceae bacterium]
MSNEPGKTALVVEGGGMRGIYAAGILHAFGRENFDPFDLYIGVSAGACHLASHLAGQNSRNFDITLRYSLTPRFINPWRFLRGGHLMDLDWMWEQTITHYRLNLKYLFENLRAKNKEYFVVATSMKTGEALYLQPDETTLEDYLKISSSIPIFYRNILAVKGEPATDGGIADSIPVRRAYARGATNIVVLRTRPSDYVKKQSRLAFLFSFYFRKYPQLVEKFKKRAYNYMESVNFIHHPPAGVRVIELAPPANSGVSRITQNEAALRANYKAGIEQGNKFMKEWRPS